MPTQFDKFDQNKINLLKNHLILSASKHTPKFYEIFVDNLKAVPKTDNPDEFEGFEEYLTPDTSFIKVIIYCTGLSPRNDQYFFSLKAQNQQEAFESGLDGISLKAYSQNELVELKSAKIQKTAEQEEIKNLKKQITELNTELQTSQEDLDRCQKGLLIAKENGNKIGGVHAGDLLSRAVTSLIKQNAPAIEKITGIEGLAGIIENGNASAAETEQNTEDAQVSFKRKETNPDAIVLSQQEKDFLSLCKVLQSHFTEPEMVSVMSILDTLSKNKSQIQPVLELIKD
jgi:hypothetical protein